MSEPEATSDREPGHEAGSGERRSGATSRRGFLATGATVTAASLVGCLGGSNDQTASEGDGNDGGNTNGNGNGNADTSTQDGGAGTAPGTTATTAGNAPDEVVIGTIHPLTGSTSYTGTRCSQAVDLAATVATENGGVESMGGAEVTVLSRDHGNDPSRAGEAVRELAEEGADILTGTYSSGVTSAAATAAERQGIPFVIDVSTAASILQERELEYVYRTQPNSREIARNTVTHTLAGAQAAGYEPETVGLFYIDTTYGQSIGDGLRTAVDEAGLELVREETIGFGETADTQVTSLREADPDVLVPTVFPQQFMGMIGAMQDQDYWPPIFSGAATAGFTAENFQEIGDDIEGSLTTGFRLDRSQDRVGQLSQRFAETYDTAPMASNQGMSYATAQVMIAAFEQAGSEDPETLNTALGELTVSDHVMAMPPITFRDDGENANALAATAQVQDLAIDTVYPEEFATSDVDTETLVSN
jgi:branched-chain amino acid transport system substrate-binding protein